MREGGLMTTVTLEEAQAQLPELVDKLRPGESVLITRQDRPVAQLVPVAEGKPCPVPGRGRGKLVIVSEDDDHLKDFEDYMP
jgi:prevent-host-death family protein